MAYYNKKTYQKPERSDMDVKCIEVKFDCTTAPDYEYLKDCAVADAMKQYNDAREAEEKEIQQELAEGFIQSADEYFRSYPEPFSLDIPECAEKVNELTLKYVQNVIDLPTDVVVNVPKEQASNKEVLKAAIKEKYGYDVVDFKGFSEASKEDILRNKTYDSISAMYQSEDFKRYLNLTANMNGYSINNTALVIAQNPDAEAVKGFYAWKEFDRSVGKGEKGIQIWCPKSRELKTEKQVDAYLQKHKNAYGDVGSPHYERERNSLIDKINKDGVAKIMDGFFQSYVFDIKQTVALGDNDNLEELLNALRFKKPLDSDMKKFDIVVQATEKAMGIESGTLKLDSSVSQQEALYRAIESYAEKTFREAPDSITGIKNRDVYTGAMHKMETMMAAYLVSKHLGIESDDKISYELCGIMKDRLSPDSIRIGRREMFTQTYNRAISFSKQFDKEFDKAFEKLDKAYQAEVSKQAQSPENESSYSQIYESVYKTFISDDMIRFTIDSLERHAFSQDEKVAYNALVEICGEALREGATADEIINAVPEAKESVNRAIELNCLPPHKAIPLVMVSAEQAISEGKLDAFKASQKENAECSAFIAKSFSWHCNYEKNICELDKVIADMSSYSKERVDCVLAREVYCSALRLENDTPDGRYSKTVREWAKGVINSYNSFQFDNFSGSIADKSHPILVNGLIERYIVLEKEKEKEIAHTGERKPQHEGLA